MAGEWAAGRRSALGGIVAVLLLALTLEARMALLMRIVCLAAATAVLSPYLVVSVPIIVAAAMHGIFRKRSGTLPFVKTPQNLGVGAE